MSEDSKISKAQQKAVHKYVKNNYDRIELTVKPKGKKEELKAHAEKNGETLNSFINRAINEAMERDNQIPDISQKDNTPADPGTASHNVFEERCEQLLKQYETLVSGTKQESGSRSAGSQRRKPESDPDYPRHETLDEKLERLRKKHTQETDTQKQE